MGYYVDGGEQKGDRLGAAPVNFLVGAGANAILPGSGAIVGTALQLFGGIFGATDEDKRRMARVQYFYALAAQGNLAAAQLMLGAIPDVSGHEQPYWQHALEQLRTSNPAVWNAAQSAGPIRTTGMGDSPESYPHMQAIALNWAQNNSPIGVASSSSPSSYTPAGGGAVVLPTGRSSQLLPAMTTTAAYNWLPVVAGVSATAIAALVAFSHRSGRRSRARS